MGIQCVCNALWSICYFATKYLRFCTSPDLDAVLTLGHDLYKHFGYTNQHLSIEDLPSRIEFQQGKTLNISKKESVYGELSQGWEGLLNKDNIFKKYIFVTGGYGTAIFKENGIIHVFHSHCRDQRGLPHPNLTLVLLRFNNVSIHSYA